MSKFFREKSQIVVLSTLNQCEIKIINYFDKNVYSVRERVKNAPSRTLYKFLSKYFIFFKFMLIKSTQNNNLRFFPKEFTHILKKYNLRLQGLKI